VVSCQLSKYLLNLAESEALKPTSCTLEEIEVGKHHMSVDIALEHDSLISVGVDGVSTSANGICGVAARRAPTSRFIDTRQRALMELLRDAPAVSHNSGTTMGNT